MEYNQHVLDYYWWFRFQEVSDYLDQFRPGDNVETPR
jgi:hypothetical protein